MLTIMAICVGASWKLGTRARIDVGPLSEVNDPVALTATRASSFSGLPIAFERNLGRADGKVKFLLHSGGAALSLSSSEAVLTLHSRKSRLARQVRMKIVGANPTAEAIGLEKLPGNVNYFLGNDPQRWRTRVPTYSRVKFKAVYDGIDLVYREDGFGRLEYDFLLSSRADIRKIRLSFPGTSVIKRDNRGALSLRLNDDELSFEPPVFYQEVDGAAIPVPGRFVIHSNRTIGFTAGPHDRSRPLVSPTTEETSDSRPLGRWGDVSGKVTARPS